ncbi:MAG: UvrD-helicase domain-containing protein [Bacteroidia bacterium]|nr:UvrD-helicase domain-containing protein [Bacteroidia bacterium]
MVEARLILEPEVQTIFSCIDNKRNFLLSGGAGSGKTFSLVQVIRQAIEEHPIAKVACVTYTNAAVKEIEERVNHNNLLVSTIHDFLWDNIKHFQIELKKTIIALANNPDVAKIAIEGVTPVPDEYFDSLEDGIQYKEYLRLRDGIISHDELLIVANYMFEKYPRLCDIVKDKFKFIFIDEYQDTSPLVVQIFLEHFSAGTKKNIIGFFGDAMQSIYEDGIGNLDQYKGDEADKVKEIKKEQNRRNPLKVIELANRLRTDGITQVPSSDQKAPNMLNGSAKQGEILFIHSASGDLEEVKAYLTNNYGWDFTNGKKTKELNLTHNLIADKAGFRGLMDIYDDDPILGLKDDIIAKIKYNKKNNKEEIEISDTDTFDNVVDKFQLKNIKKQLKKDVLLEDLNKAELYNLLKDKLFSEVKKMYLNKDALLDDKKQEEEDDNKKGSKRDNLIKHLFKIQRNISLYSSGQYNEFLRMTDYRHNIRTIADKKVLKDNIESLVAVGEKTIEVIITEAHEKGVCLADERLERFRTEKEYLYNRVKKVQFKEFQKLFEYLEGKTPFSTKHKTKGDEFDDVLVVLDNGGWNKYNFENLFLGTGSANVLSNSQKLFYVCCTRAKEKLVVFYHNPSAAVLAKAKEWFGDVNVISI